MRGISRILTGRRLVVAIAAVLAAVAGAGGTALALTTSAPSHAVSVSRGDLTRAALKVTAGTPFLDISMGRLGGTLLRVSTPDGAPVRPVLSGSQLIVLSLAGASGPGGSGGSGGSAGSGGDDPAARRQPGGQEPGAAGAVLPYAMLKPSVSRSGTDGVET